MQPSTMKHIVLTGFEPFGGENINPSWQAICQLQQELSAATDLHLTCLELPVTFEGCFAPLQQVLQQQPVDLVLCIGQAGGRSHIGLEKVAINFAHARIADNAGAQPLNTSLQPNGPAAYFSTLPLGAMLHACQQQGVPTQLSFTAGTYVCNALFYQLMHFLTQQQSKALGGFIHIPYAPQQVLQNPQASLSTTQVVTALRACIDAFRQGLPEPAGVTGGTLD